MKMDDTSRATALPGLNPSAYQRHTLHGESAVWSEKNCYIDVWITLLHALGADPHAMLGMTLALDFEGDQWTFFKPSHDELRRLYGLDVQELTVWRPLLAHALEHLSAGKFICVETDAFWLPDTAGTDYRSRHTKTTVVLVDVDVPAKRLVYFHNTGCHTLSGDDFDQIFRLPSTLNVTLNSPTDDAYLPFFAEVIRADRLVIHPTADLQRLSRAQLPDLRRRRPTTNPVRRFAERLDAELPWLKTQGVEHYHAWAFANTRQLGAGFELTSRWLNWLDLGPEAEPAVQGLDAIARQAKTLILKTARTVTSTKPADLAGLLGPMADAWDASMVALDRLG